MKEGKEADLGSLLVRFAGLPESWISWRRRRRNDGGSGSGRSGKGRSRRLEEGRAVVDLTKRDSIFLFLVTCYDLDAHPPPSCKKS